MGSTGLIFDIKRFSIHDGPGIRSTVFMKGCPLSCSWCHNPESQSFKTELIFRTERCLGCESCLDACPEGAISVIDGKIITDQTRCAVCGECVLNCYPGAREIIGQEVTPQDVVDELIRDQLFYEESGGGVTFSGGEPLSQPDFLEETLKLCKNVGLNTALDTCGAGSWNQLDRQIKSLDLVLFDLKILDDGLHKQYTGVSNTEILKNFHLLTKSDVNIIVRRPVIPGVNDSREEINRLGKFLTETNGNSKIDLLPYHAMSLDKYKRLGREQLPATWESPSLEMMEQISDQLSNLGHQVGWRGKRLWN